jgi:hypothetical protein
MAFLIIDPQRAQYQNIAVTDTVKNHNLGTIVQAYDPNYGLGTFIYLQGVASTVVGSLVVYDSVSGGFPTFTTTLCPSTAGLGKSVAVAMSANVALQYGWYCIQGTVPVAATTFAAAGIPYIGTAGQVISTQANGKQIVNCIGLTAVGTPSAGLVVCQMTYPFAQGQIV